MFAKKAASIQLLENEIFMVYSFDLLNALDHQCKWSKADAESLNILKEYFVYRFAGAQLAVNNNSYFL